MKLSILIPTYNRAVNLKKNLELLSSYIHRNKLEESVCIIISDNASTDNTQSVVSSMAPTNIRIEYYRQENNWGYCKNVLSVISRATTDWVMLLGDDDYLEPWYIKRCIAETEKNPNLGCIIPNYIDYNPAMNTYGRLREENCETQYYKSGFDACFQNAWRAHQLSGLCFRRENVVEEFMKRGMDNLYPQIFFVAYNALRYDVLHFGQRCLAVSSVPQSKKDWDYGKDGLVNDVFENFKNLGVSYRQRAQLESHFLKEDPRYFWTTKDTNSCIEHILKRRNVSYLARYYISKQILHAQCYSGKKLRIKFYFLARFILFKQLITGKPIAI